MGKVALDVDDDEVPWCAAFACAAIEETGYVSPRTGRARGFVPGRLMSPCDHRLGSIVVLSSDRGPASGHVGFLAGIEPGKVHLLGGNQGNRVCIAPFQAAKIVHMLWPATAPAYTHYPMAPTMVGGKPVDDG